MGDNGKTTQILYIKRITGIARAEDVSQSFNEEAVEYNEISQVNWKEYPYKPDVKFAIAHDGEHIYLNWQVCENEVKAVCKKDGGEVWKDSCVEFFISFDGHTYYNIESNCMGKLVVATGSGRNKRESIPEELIKEIKRWPSLGDKPVEGMTGKWELSLIIPNSIFCPNELCPLNFTKATGNFYKCGDGLKQPHFLSWNAIESETPNFHLPEYFGKLNFK